MPRIIDGTFTTPAGRFALVAPRFNHCVLQRWVAGAIDGLVRHGVPSESLDVIWVPGSCEIPLATKRLAESKNYVALIALGAIIRGETSHYDHVASEAAKGVGQVGM